LRIRFEITDSLVSPRVRGVHGSPSADHPPFGFPAMNRFIFFPPFAD
jgi:hypothetical protein